MLSASSPRAVPAIRQRALAKLLPWLLLLCLLPVWGVRYVPLYDYQNHLLEAQVVARYDDPALGYAAGYTIQPGWQLRSNALWTVLVAGLIAWMSADVAGKLVVSLAVGLLVTSLAALIQQQRRPWWLLLAAPPLVYNLAFTAGMINWSLGLGFALWALACYHRWQTAGDARWLLALGGLLLLIYVAHVLAWLLCLVIIATLCAADQLPRRRVLALGAVSLSAAPLLALTRPAYVLLPLVIYAALLATAAAVRRLRLNRAALCALGALAVAVYAAGWRALRPVVLTLLPDVGYSLDSKLMTPTRLLTLPYQLTPIADEQVLVNLALLTLLAAVTLLIAWGWCVAGAEPRWLAVLGVLALCYALIPTRTQDIIITEPRVLLLALIVGVIAAPLPRQRWMRRSLVTLLTLLTLLTAAGAWRYAQRYDAAAQRWADALRQIPPAQSVLVLAGSSALGSSPLARFAGLSQTFDPNQFSSVYALERGGFVSNTFFNGPLGARQPDRIPPYWWVDFQPAAYVQQHCAELRAAYAYVLLWNPGGSALHAAVNACYPTPLTSSQALAIRTR